MPVKLYYAPGACSFASHIALEETGIKYETQRRDLAAGAPRKPADQKRNPRGRGPPGRRRLPREARTGGCRIIDHLMILADILLACLALPLEELLRR